MARLAKSLEVLRSQIDAQWPNRSKVTDGWIASAEHRARSPVSDHNENASGVVQAIDVTHDAINGPDALALAEALIVGKDRRLKYAIHAGRIVAGNDGPASWVWRDRNKGAGDHVGHIHISVEDDPAVYDDATPWQIVGAAAIIRPPLAMSVLHRRMADHIIQSEAKLDTRGNLAIYNLSDGSSEIAGVNSRYHAAEVAALKALISAGEHEAARQRAAEYIIKYTQPVVGWTSDLIGWVSDPGVEFFLRDTFFNRGPKGAAIILQKALGVDEDGEVGPITRGAIARVTSADLLTKLRKSREAYERNPPAGAGFSARNESSGVWTGLVNRWNRVLSFAKQLQQVAPMPVQPVPPVTPVPPPIIPDAAKGAIDALIEWFLGRQKPTPVPVQPLPAPPVPAPTPGAVAQVDAAFADLAAAMAAMREDDKRLVEMMFSYMKLMEEKKAAVERMTAEILAIRAKYTPLFAALTEQPK